MFDEFQDMSRPYADEVLGLPRGADVTVVK